MRVLHLLNIPLSAEQIQTGGNAINTSGGWMAALLCRLRALPAFDIGFAAFANVNELKAEDCCGISSFRIPRKLDGTERGLGVCANIVEKWRPDLLHIHGTENCFGLLSARRMVRCLSLISLQGLMGPYSEWRHFFGAVSPWDVFKMHRWPEIMLRRGQYFGYRQYRRYAKREREILAGNRYFMGRTEWDRAYLRAVNPSARYYYGGELLREHFWGQPWSISGIRRHRIGFTNAGHPRKGIEVALNAVRLLKRDFSDIEIAIAGGISKRSGYGRYIRGRIEPLGPAAIELGPLSAGEMHQNLLKSHAFVSTSFIENSSNACCEAQLIGMPLISSYVGGMPSLIDHGQTGLFFVSGDAPMLAEVIRQVFEDDDLAERLGRQAREAARSRHDPEQVVAGVLIAYDDVLKQAACGS